MAADYSEWDPSAYSGVDSDYWEAKASAEGGGTPVEAGAGLVEGHDAAREIEEVGGQEAEKTQVDGGTEEIVQILDDEPAA